MSEFENIVYDQPADGVARITLARPERRNAQDVAMLYELDRAFTLAGKDPQVKVVILAAQGQDFSSGHVITDLGGDPWRVPGEPVVYQSVRDGQPGVEGQMTFELDGFIGLSTRWREFPKPTIAQVQGRVIAGGLMLVWPCDIIIASRDASFRDPVVAFGMNGHEYFVHAYELGARKAKELLFTGDAISAEDACTLGMVNHVVEREELETFTLRLAMRIATRPAFGLKLAKMSVNQSLDAQGLPQAVNTAFALHTIAHAHNLDQHGVLVEPSGPPMVREEIRSAS